MKWLSELLPHTRVTENYAATECGGVTYSPSGDHNRILDGYLIIVHFMFGWLWIRVIVKLIDSGPYTSLDKPFPRGEILVFIIIIIIIIIILLLLLLSFFLIIIILLFIIISLSKLICYFY